jgi:hypothetical protein
MVSGKSQFEMRLTALRRFPPFAAWRTIGTAGTHFGHSPFAGRCRGGSILHERTERDGFDRERGLNPHLWTVYGESYPGA